MILSYYLVIKFRIIDMGGIHLHIHVELKRKLILLILFSLIFCGFEMF